MTRPNGTQQQTWFSPNYQEAEQVYITEPLNLPITSPIFSVETDYLFGFRDNVDNPSLKDTQEARMRRLFPFSQKIRGDGACFFNSCLTYALNKCVENPEKWNVLRTNLINYGAQNIADTIGEEGTSLDRQKVNQLLQVKGDTNIIRQLSATILVPQHHTFIQNRNDQIATAQTRINTLNTEIIGLRDAVLADDDVDIQERLTQIQNIETIITKAQDDITLYSRSDRADTYLESDVLPIITELCGIERENIISLSTDIISYVNDDTGELIYDDDMLSDPNKIYLWNPGGGAHFNLLYSASDVTLQENIKSLSVIDNILRNQAGFQTDYEIGQKLKLVDLQSTAIDEETIHTLLHKLCNIDKTSGLVLNPLENLRTQSALYVINNINPNILEKANHYEDSELEIESDLLCTIIKNLSYDTLTEELKDEYTNIAIAIANQHPNIAISSQTTNNDYLPHNSLYLASKSGAHELTAKILEKNPQIIESSDLVNTFYFLTQDQTSLANFKTIISYLKNNNKLSYLYDSEPISLLPIADFYSYSNKEFLEEILNLEETKTNPDLKIALLNSAITTGNPEAFDAIINHRNIIFDIDMLKNAQNFLVENKNNFRRNKTIEPEELKKAIDLLVEIEEQINAKIEDLQPPIAHNIPLSSKKPVQPDNSWDYKKSRFKKGPLVETFKTNSHQIPGTKIDVITVIPFKHINHHRKYQDPETIDLQERGGDFRVMINIYDKLDHRPNNNRQENITDTFLSIINFACASTAIDTKQASQLILLAKEHNGVGRFFDHDREKALQEFQKIGITPNQANNFSSAFQKSCKECGIYSGRSTKNAKFVGLRLPFVPEEVLEKLNDKKFDNDQSFDDEVENSVEFVKPILEKVEKEISRQNRSRTSNNYQNEDKVFRPVSPTGVSEFHEQSSR